MMKQINVVKMCGDVLEVSEDVMKLKTIERTFNGNEYEEIHTVYCDNHGQKKGDRVKFFGSLKTIKSNLGPQTIIDADKTTLAKATKKEKSCNVAKIVGKAPQTFQFFPRAEGKMAFGNLLLLTGEETDGAQFHRGVFFGQIAHYFSRMCNRNSIVQMIGRIRNREYVDNDGESRTMLEVIVDPDQTKVLKRGKVVDEFADYNAKDLDPAAKPELQAI